MPVRNQNWYDLNESRPYPVDDTATGLADSGERLPSGLIADLNMRFPEAAGRRAWLGAVTNTAGLVTVTILAAAENLAVASFMPLAVIYATKPLVPRRPYPLQPQYPGVGGWITFGDEVDETLWWGKFSAPSQSLLHPATARSYRELPVPDVTVRGSADPLTGIVRLESGNDIEIVKECREIPGYAPEVDNRCDTLQQALRDVIVFRLRGFEPGVAGLPSGEFNVFEKYVGPCGGRPESRNCGDPEPIEYLAGVSPDCCGNITINFTGCAIVSEIKEEAVVDDMGDVVQVDTACGFVIDCGLGLSNACVTPDRLPTADGTLPNEYDDLCESVTVISVSVPPDTPTEDPGDPEFPEESASVAASPLLPVTFNFNDVGDAVFFIPREGEMLWYAAGEYGSLGANSTSIRNLTTFNRAYPPEYRKLVGRFNMLAASPGEAVTMRSGAATLHNAAMVLDWRLVSGSTTRRQYWLAELDWDGAYLGYPAFRIAFFNGTNYTTFLAVPIPGLVLLNQTYEIEFSAWPNLNLADRSWLEATLRHPGGATIASIGPLSVSGYGETINTRFGMHSNRAATSWSYFSVENL